MVLRSTIMDYYTLTNVTNCTEPPAGSFPPDLFTLDEKRDGALVLHFIGAFYAFGCLSIVCNYYFMSSIEAICTKLNLSGDVAGATFMSIGTSAPELITACIGVFVTETNVGLETVAGSTVFNMLFIIALVILTANTIIEPEIWPVARDLGAFVMVNVALCFSCWDGAIQWYEASIVLLIYVAYITLMVFNKIISRKFDAWFQKEEKRPLFAPKSGSFSATATDGDYYKMVDEPGSLSESRVSSVTSIHAAFMEEFGSEYRSQLKWPDSWMDRITYIVFFPMRVLFLITIPDCNREGCWEHLYMLTFLVSGAWIGIGCYVMVWMIEIIGLTVAIPEPVLAITALAVGTSIPDCVASVVAARKGHQTMAISNVLGSNIFDLACTSLPWILKIAVSGSITSTIPVANTSVIFTIISLLTSTVLLVIVIIASGWRLGTRTAIILFGLYSIYLVISILYEFNVFGLVNLPYCEKH